MILYFSGTGNSLAISRQLAERLGEQVMPLSRAVARDLSQERRIGLVFPCYWFNTPRAVTELVPRLQLPKDAYVFIVIPCGAQAGNAIWTVRRMLASKGVEVTYSHKIRVPDNSAVGFGRNPNDQVWKFDRYAGPLCLVGVGRSLVRHPRRAAPHAAHAHTSRKRRQMHYLRHLCQGVPAR